MHSISFQDTLTLLAVTEEVITCRDPVGAAFIENRNIYGTKHVSGVDYNVHALCVLELSA